MPSSSTRRKKKVPARPAPARRPGPGTSRTEQVSGQQTQRLRQLRRQTLTAYVLMALGVAVGIGHLVEHLGAYTLYRAGADDLLAGYPMAGLLVVLGLTRLPRRY